MFGLIAKLFTGSKITDTVLDVAQGWLENKNSSAQDKKELIEKLTDFHRATKHQSITRRFIAVTFTISYLSLILFYVLSIFVASAFGFREILTFAGQVKLLINDMKEPIMLVLGFYFGLQAVNMLRK